MIVMAATLALWLCPTPLTSVTAVALTIAQTTSPTPTSANVASDAITCWWKTDTNAVHLGEQFRLTLTCGLMDTGDVTVVPDEKSVEPTTVQLAPFEVVRGVRHQDIVEASRRYLQYEYTLRLLGEGYFGRDVDIPSLTVTYRVQSPDGDTQGRDRLYALPAMPMRIISLAPSKATDIRDASRE